MPCKKCNSDFASGEAVAQCTKCKHEFHPACTRVGSSQSFTKSKTKNWKCVTCDDSNYSETANVPEDKRWLLETLSSMESRIIVSFEEKISYVNDSINTIKESLKVVNDKVTSLHEQQEDMKVRCDALEHADARRGNQVADLQRKIRDLEQHSRCANIEIVGMPKTANENVVVILENIAKALSIPFDKDHVSVAHRLRLFSAKKHAHPPIIVQFVSRTVKENWLGAMRRKKRLSTKEVSQVLTEGAVYINDHLTAENKELLGRARRLLRERRIAYAVYVNGKVLIKPREGDNAIRVQEMKDLDPYDRDTVGAI